MSTRRPSARPLAALLLAALAVAAAGTLAVPSASAAAATVSVTALHFQTSYKTPDGATRQCDVVGDLYVPSTASASQPAPAILTTNGFGGSKADQAAAAQAIGALGYVTLSYSGLGFGGSGCPITDDDPNSDGVVARQLVDFLGGKTGVAYAGFTALGGWTGPVPALDVVRHDDCDHSATPVCGASDAFDPRVGMLGGSYGGEIQFAAASVDPRIDTIVPLITWHDLSYSLDPGNADLPGGSLAPGLPGVYKTEWDNFFFSLGIAAVGGSDTSAPGNPQANAEPQPASLQTFGARDAMCPGFTPETCVASQQGVTTGYADATAQKFFSHSSVTSYLDRIRIPVFLGQGQHDTLFNLTEASATYTALKQRGVPVKMLWQSWGHSQIGAAPGEYPAQGDGGATLPQTYQGKLIVAWFDHYLRDQGSTPALDFSYFRDWAYTGSGTDGVANEPAAQEAYAQAPAYPLPTTTTFALSGTDALVPKGDPVTGGAASLTAIPGGDSSFSIVDAVGVVTSYSNPLPLPPPSDAAGSVASWTTAPLTADTDVVGVPTLDVTLTSGQAQTADPASQLILFGKLYDVAPDGSVDLPARLVAPVRVNRAAAAGAPMTVRISLPGIVHRFSAGHRLRLVLASGDSAYAGNTTARTASFRTSPASPGLLTVPLASAVAAAQPTPSPTAAAGPLPAAPLPAASAPTPSASGGTSAQPGTSPAVAETTAATGSTAPASGSAVAGNSLPRTGASLGVAVLALLALLGGLALRRRSRGA